MGSSIDLIPQLKEQLFNTIYLPNFHFLHSMENTFPSATGTFVIPEVQYTKGPRGGLSAASGVILYNQIIITYTAAALIQNKISAVNDFTLEPEAFISFGDHMLIQKFDLAYNKPVLASGKEIPFKVTIEKCVSKFSTKSLIFFEFKIDIDNGKHTGTATYCYCGDKKKRVEQLKKENEAN